MKRIISFLLILALLICLAACGNDGESSSSESQAEQSSTETQSESMESESVTESETQGNTSSESATESESQSQSTESVTESETQSESSETATESEIESETNSESESESTTESETESEIESESSTETESETESESDSENQNPTTVAEWVEANKEQINTILSNKCLDKIVNDCYFGMYTKDQIQNARWVLEGETEATGAKLVCEVNCGEYSQLQVIDIDFSSPVKLDKIDNLSNCTISRVWTDMDIGYKNADLVDRTDLINALFKAVGVNEVSGPRYLKDNGEGTMDYGKTHGYTIVEVADNEIKEYSIRIIHTSAYLEDEQAIQKLENPAEYKITDSKEVDISGASVEYVAQ